MERNHQKRRIKLIKPKLQLRLVASFFGLAALALVVETLVLGAKFTDLANGLPTGGTHLAEKIPTVLFTTLAWSFFIVLPALLLVGVHITFRVAGPLYRFERHLEEVASGEWPQPCKLRKSDDLQEFCRLLNAALDSAREQGRQAALAQSGTTEGERPKSAA